LAKVHPSRDPEQLTRRDIERHITALRKTLKPVTVFSAFHDLRSFFGWLGAVFSSPAVANGVVYIGAGRSNLYALNAANGTELWNFTAGDVINSSPAVANGAVYVTSLDGNVYAFHLPGGIAGINRPNPRRLHPNYALSSGRTR
jgi:hypothetical protein